MTCIFRLSLFWRRRPVDANLVHLVTVGYGVTVGWTAPIIPLLRSEDTPLPAGPITVEQASWIGSSLCIGGMTGTVLFALIHTYFGKKIGLLLLAVPHLVSHVLLSMRLSTLVFACFIIFSVFTL